MFPSVAFVRDGYARSAIVTQKTATSGVGKTAATAKLLSKTQVDLTPTYLHFSAETRFGKMFPMSFALVLPRAILTFGCLDLRIPDAGNTNLFSTRVLRLGKPPKCLGYPFISVPCLAEF